MGEVAQSASNLSELEMQLGEVAGAVDDAEQSVTYADRSGDNVGARVSARIRLADAYLATGRWTDASQLYSKVEADFVAEYQSFQWLPGNWGFRHDEARLAEAEQCAWRATPSTHRGQDFSDSLAIARSVAERASRRMDEDIKAGQPLLDIALDHLSLGRAALYAAILEHSDFRLLASDFSHIDAAVSGLRRAGTQHWIPASLLTRAWLRSLTGVRTGPESAQSDLDEAWEIAERGSMRLFLADIHLYRAQLFGLRVQDLGLRNEHAQGGVRNEAAEPYPWESPRADLEAAEKLINDCGYHRRDEELADAKRAILGA